MAKIFTLIMVFTLIMAGIASAASLPQGLRVSLLSQDPDPVSPGEFVELRFKLENPGTETLTGVYARLETQSPLSIDDAKNSELFVGNLWGGLYGEYGAVVKFRLRVAPDAPTGTSKVKLMTRHSGQSAWTSEEFSVTIRETIDQVIIDQIRVEPRLVAPGGVVNVSFALLNKGFTEAKDLSITLDLSSPLIPFAPYLQPSQKRLSFLGAGQSGKLSFMLKAAGTASSQVYKIPITLSYLDSQGTRHTKTDVLALEIGGKPRLYVALEQSNVFRPDMTGDIVVSLVNTGNSDIKFLRVEFLERGDYLIISGKEQYVGNLASDDFETVKVRVYLKCNCTQFKLPMVVTYSDAGGEEYSEIREIAIPFFTKREAITYGLEKQSNTVGILIVLGIVALGLFCYSYIKRRRRQLLAQNAG